jgi:hypothetical protein
MRASGFPGDGIAFVLHSKGAGALGLGGGGLGYSGIDPSFEVEFDIFGNPEANDPDGNHVAIMKNGDHTNHLDSATPAFSLFGDTIFVWIKYSKGTHKLKAFVNDAPNRPPNASVSREQNLKRLLGRRARVGFTGGTGLAFALQDILRFKLRQRG